MCENGPEKKMPAVGFGDGKKLKEEKGLGGGGDINGREVVLERK